MLVVSDQSSVPDMSSSVRSFIGKFTLIRLRLVADNGLVPLLLTHIINLGIFSASILRNG